MTAAQKEYARQQAQAADPLRASLLLLTMSLESGLILMVDGNHGVVKLSINGVWHKKTFEEFIESFTGRRSQTAATDLTPYDPTR